MSAHQAGLAPYCTYLHNDGDGILLKRMVGGAEEVPLKTKNEVLLIHLFSVQLAVFRQSRKWSIMMGVKPLTYVCTRAAIQF